MIVYSYAASKVTELWLFPSDQQDPRILEKINQICREQRKKKRNVVIFASGAEELTEVAEKLPCVKSEK